MNPPKTVILFAEDDEDNFSFCKEAVLKVNKNCDVRWAENGEEVIRYLERNDVPRPSLILMDLNMPKKGGLEVLKEIRRQAGWTSIPVLIMTTSLHSKDVMECYRYGANSVIIKPMELRMLNKFFESIYDYWFRTVQLPRPS